MNRTDVHLAKRQAHVPWWVLHSASAAAIGLLLGYLGPFRSGTALAPAVRYPFWLGLALFGYACALASLQLGRSLTSAVRLGVPMLLLIAALFSSVPQTLATAWAFSLVQEGRTFTPLQLPALFGAVLVVQFGITAAVWGVAQRTRPAEAPPEARHPIPAFLQRMPARIGRDLVALEAEDHYLRVHTALGSDLLLMRLSDAVVHLEDYDGLQVHRSWWVAAGAVAGTVTQGGRITLRLENGLTVPVSRTYLPSVRERRWPPV